VTAQPREERRVVVLVEGRSDAAVVRALLGRRPPTEVAGIEVVSMEGVTNVERHLARLETTDPTARVAGLCDRAEAAFVVRALQRRGHRVRGPADLPTHGFFVCDADLEDELIRAVGPEAVADALAELGDEGRFVTFRQQPEWRDRPLHDQLRRFAGSRSGRKEQLARALATRLDPTRLPTPLHGLVAHLLQDPPDPAGPPSAAGPTGPAGRQPA
jgi:hypothetical protein